MCSYLRTQTESHEILYSVRCLTQMEGLHKYLSNKLKKYLSQKTNQWLLNLGWKVGTDFKKVQSVHDHRYGMFL